MASERPPDRPPPSIDWAAVLAQHDRWLRTIVYARVGDAGDVEDVMQEIAAAAVAQQSPLQDPHKVAPWLYQLAVRQSMLHRRRCGRRRKLLERYREQATGRDPHELDPLQWLLVKERAELVRDSMFELPETDRELLLLKYTERWSYKDLARHLGVSESAIESRLHRARAKLRWLLEEKSAAQTPSSRNVH